MQMMHLWVACTHVPSGKFMVRGFKQRHLFMVLMLSIVKMDVAPVLAIAQSAAIMMAFACCGISHLFLSIDWFDVTVFFSLFMR
jgi:hypothetical protein